MPTKYLQPNYFLGENETVWYCPPRFILYGRIGKKLLIVQRSCSVVQSPYFSKSFMKNLAGPDAETGHQITIYSSQHFKFNENTKMSPCLPSPLSPYACTICKCHSDSLKFTRTSRAWANNCFTSLFPTAQVSWALSSVYGQLPLGREQLKAALSISGSSPQKSWELS